VKINWVGNISAKMNCAPIRVFLAAMGLTAESLIANLQAQQPSPSPLPFPSWQDEISKGYLPYHQLTVTDFHVNDEAHPGMAYFVQPFVHFFCHYEMKPGSGGFVYAYVTDWIVFSGFDKNLSSRNSKFREMKTYLPYIQGFLDITELHARKFAALNPGDLPSGRGETFEKARAQLDDRLRALYQTRAWEAAKEADTYQEATNKGLNQKKVRELTTELQKRLAATPSINPPPQLSNVPVTR
jgi:hypothetical protein